MLLSDLVSDNRHWIASDHVRLPDFIICGAMKSGTSTIHYILNQHPKVFIPENEIHFFDIDNILQHPDFNYYDGNKWFFQRIINDPEKFWNWYASHFPPSDDPRVIGEDSTTYLTSEITARRISIQKKKIKIIILLRHPTLRAYSQYLHMLRTGRAMHTFEGTIINDPFSILHRSLYKEQIEGFYKYIPKELIKIVVFENFINNKDKAIKEICNHINVNHDLLPNNAFYAHRNIGSIPKYIFIEIVKNRFFRGFGNLQYHDHLPRKLKIYNATHIRNIKLAQKVYRKLNPLITKKKAIISKSTKAFLDEFFIRELEGINDIVEEDIMSVWFR